MTRGHNPALCYCLKKELPDAEPNRHTIVKRRRERKPNVQNLCTALTVPFSYSICMAVGR